MNKEKKVLVKNTILLYIMRFSMFFFAFLVTPYLSRILGKTIYAKIVVANALMIYFFYIIDFGFMLSGTEEIAKNHQNKQKISEINTAIFTLKILLSILSFIILFIIFAVSESYRQDWLLYLLFLISTIVDNMVPTHVFRGIEQMKAATYSTLASKIVYTILIFLIVKGPKDILWIPILMIIGDSVSLSISLFFVRYIHGIKLVRINKEIMMEQIKKSSIFFLSRIAGTVYGAFNVLIINTFSQVDAGLYGSANKLISIGQTALSPISDSIYPYMTKNKDFKLIKNILKYLMPIILLGATVIYIFAPNITALLFGKDFYDSGDILRALLPVAILTLPQYILGFPTMSALGIVKYANFSVYISSTIHIIILFIMWQMNILSAVNLARLVSFTTLVDFLYRMYHLNRRWKEIKMEKIKNEQ